MERSFRKPKPTLRDVARTAGVSVATVSRVLNTPDVVRPDTRTKVEAVIAQLRFVRSAAARTINTGRSKIIGALVPTLDSDIFAFTIDAIENRLAGFGLSLVVATTGDDRQIEVEKAKALIDIGVEGIFLSGVTHDAALHDLIDRTGVPAVAISYFDPGYPLPTIGYDNAAATAQAMRHLVDLGHRRIALVHGPAEHNDRTRDRIAGAAGFAAELTPLETELSIEGGSKAVTRAQAQGHRFDAYLCVSDVMAFGVLFALQRAGLRVPQDLSVMGIHDLPGARMTCPSLSTVRLPAREMGERAATALAHWVEDGLRPQSVCLPTDLKIRGSTAPRHPTDQAPK